MNSRHFMPIANPQNCIDITYKEVMQLWNIKKDSAVHRLSCIRTGLGKKRSHKLTVHQFCQAEDITVQEFYNMINFHL